MNRLSSESSLYLRSYAGSPVNCYPWSAEAFAAKSYFCADGVCAVTTSDEFGRG